MAAPVVMFETLWAESSDGWAIAARAYARAMRLAGIDVSLHSWMPLMGEPAPEVLAEVEGMLRATPRWDFYVFSTPLASPTLMLHPLNVLRDYARPRAFYTMFERSSVQEPLVEQLNALEGVWVPCSRNQAALKEAGCPKTTWIPYPYFDSDPHLKLPEPKQKPRTFYWIGRWEPRKAPDNLIRAFLMAFNPGEAELVLKLSPSPWTRPFPSPEEVVRVTLDTNHGVARRWTEQQVSEAVSVLRGKFTSDEMLGLHSRCDIYVSASRGEGIDLPSHSAKLAGRRIVTTDSGGPVDFLNEDDVLVPARGLVAATDYDHFWGRGAQYSDYRLDDLVSALQVARAEPRAKQSRMPDRHRAENVGRELLNWVEGCSGD